MRIAFITADFPALSETFIVDHITGLIDRGHTVDIFADGARDTEILHPAVEKYGLLDRTHYWPSMPAGKLQRALKAVARAASACLANPRMARVAAQLLAGRGQRDPFSRPYLLGAAMSLRSPREYDVIHGQFGPDGIKAILLRDAGALRGRVVVSFRGHDLSGFILANSERIYDRLFREAELLMPVSAKMKNRLVELGCDANRIEVLRTGVDLEKFSPAKGDRDPQAPVRIISVGRFVEKKGFEYGIRAVAKVAAANPNIEYEIVGDGSLRAELQSLIQQLNVGGVIRLLGAKPPEEVARILPRADIMLTPSVTAADGDEEGIPNTTREGMACALAIVATDHAGIGELVEDGKSGYIVPERDVDGLAEKLTVLIQNADLRAGMGAAGRAFMEQNDDIDLINDRLVALYHNALQPAPIRP